MKGWRFYLEFADKTAKHKDTPKKRAAGERHDKGTVIAVYWGDYSEQMKAHPGSLEAVGAVQDFPNCPVASTAVSFEYLCDNAKRIPEAQARQIHPELFKFLDSDN